MSVTNVNSENVNSATLNNVELGENNKLYAINAEASRQGRSLSERIVVKLDSGAVGENWIEPGLVRQLELRTRSLGPDEQRVYYNRLYEGQGGFKPEKMASVKLNFLDWGFAIEVDCCIFPELKDKRYFPEERVVIGDRDCEKFHLMKFAEKEIEPLESIEAVPESEHIDESLQDVDEVDPERLMEGKFIHIGQQVSDSEGEGDEWQSHIGEMFPIGSEIRSALIRVLEKHVASDTISNMLKGRKLKVTPFSAKLKEGLRWKWKSSKQINICEHWTLTTKS